MKIPFLATCLFGLVSGVQAHEADMPIVVHVAEHGWMLLALIALVAIGSPLLRRRH